MRRKHARARITPAYTGKTRRKRQRRFVRKDHPRVYGENYTRLFPLSFTPGSPPRIRGKQVQTRKLLQLHRITPAYTGKTEKHVGRQHRGKDHPRVYGENERGLFAVALLAGSPPRIRGKHVAIVQPQFLERITPAYTGKTEVLIILCLSIQDHPRVYGENAENIHLFRR